MAQITQHEAAELWELCRDHVVGASSIRFMAQGVRDPQLRSMLERHAGEYERAGHRIHQFLHEHGTGGYGGGPGAYGEFGSPGFGQAGTHGPWSTQSPTHGAWPAPNAGYTSGSSPFDLMAAATCLDMCKSMAVKCVWGATEASQPVRSYLHQLAGEHLRMAEEQYHWLERHGAYASPKADPAAVNEYSQKIRQLIQAGQQLTQQISSGYIPQAVAHGGPTASHVAPEYTQGAWNVSPGGMHYVAPGGTQQAVSPQHQPAWSTHGSSASYSASYDTGGHGSGYDHEHRGESR